MSHPQLVVKDRLPHTWPLFFTRHGRFTTVQQQAIPPILDGHDTLVIATTASGKTEAVLAPLLERHWQWLNQATPDGLGLLYICPTRALVRDLYERLSPILSATDMMLAMKTGDTGPLPAGRPPALLLTTPESTDALLTREPRLLAKLQAIVLDEIHLFDNTPRGDHLRCLLPRIERIRRYADPQTGPAQRVALSATVPDPAGVARRYLHQGVVVQVPGGPHLIADVRPLYDLDELAAALAQRTAQKSLVFCHTRREVEQTAAFLRRRLPHHAELFVHYSNLERRLRREVEERFAAAAVAICVCTSTLELGIDIGTVDDVVLLGAPYNLTSFLQRIGRGSRRQAQRRVLCLPKSPSEWARFEALLVLAASEEPAVADATAYGFRPSVLVQQIFSLIRQSPTGAIRLADVRHITPPETTNAQIRGIVSHLAFTGYLRSGRLGEWKPDILLQELFDQHEIYSNIGAELLTATAVDAYTGQEMAKVGRVYPKGTVLLLGGKPMVVVWQEKSRFGLAPSRRRKVDEVLRLHPAPAAIPFSVTQAVARLLNLEPGHMATLPAETGLWLYHFWGTVWGQLLTAILAAHDLRAESVNEVCLYLQPAVTQLPPWEDVLAQRAIVRAAAALAGRLEMGRFHGLLPDNVASAATIVQLNVTRFRQLYQSAVLVPAEDISQQLLTLRH